MHNRKFKTSIFGILTVLWIWFIISNSVQNGTESTQASGFIVDILQKPIQMVMPKWDTVQVITFVRKTAHFVEFFVLAMLTSLTFSTASKKSFLVNSMFVGLLVAVTDEFVQLSSVGRTGKVQDVVLDFSGVVVGTIAVFIYRKIKLGQKRKHYSKKEPYKKSIKK